MAAGGAYPRMTGRIAIVTGANSGIGKETARGLAELDAAVVLACRDAGRGDAAKREIEADTGNRRLAVLPLDLGSHRSVRAFAAAFTARYPALHVLVNNAGGITARRVLTEDGVESTFASNHLGHFLLTNLLLDRLKASAPARIVNVSSQASQYGGIDFDDLAGARRWSGMRAYAQSKLANVVFAFELARRLAGTRVVANAMHPGVVRTGFGMHGAGWVGVGVRIARPFMIAPAKGADTAVWLAASPEAAEITGRYLHRRRPIEPNPLANDRAVARRLWEASEALAGLSSRDTPS